MALNQIVLVTNEQLNTLQDRVANRLSGCRAMLFTNNATITRDTILADLVEAAWTGYSRVVITGWTGAADMGDGAHVVASNTTTVTFTNSSAAAVTFYGLFLLANTAGPIGGTNMGQVTIPPGMSVSFTIQVTERSEYASSP